MSIPVNRLAAIRLLNDLNRDIRDAKVERPNQAYGNPMDIMNYVGKAQELANKVDALIKADEGANP